MTDELKDKLKPAETQPDVKGDEKAKGTFVSFSLLDLSADRNFPGNLYLCLHHKMVRYRNKGDMLDAEAFNRLVYNQVRFVFVEEADRTAFDAWIKEDPNQAQAAAVKKENPEAEQIVEAAQEQRRAMMDIFANPKDDRQVKAAVDTSKKLVSEFLRKPFAINNIQSMQRYGKGCVDHSVNVSVMSVFLGLRMGYTHQLILENLALGGLFHDVGKVLIEKKDDAAMTGEDDPEMQQHPKIGAKLLEKNPDITNEVRMIVNQHHEFLDGTGYPARLKGLAIYDLARLVTIANTYDNLISESTQPNMKDRISEALDRLEQEFEGKLDPKKLEKVTKVLRYSLL